MSDKPTIKVRGGRQTRKEPKKKTNKSCFLLTISTNQRYKPDDPHIDSDMDIFEDTIKDIVNNIDKYIRVHGGEGHTWSNDFIKDAEVDYTVELGPKTNALHGHILIKLQHHTRVSLDYQKIKDYMKEVLGLDNVYLFNRLVRPSSDTFLIEYVDKMK